MQRITRIVAALLIASLIGACDSPTSATSIDVTLTSNPDPAIAEESTGVTYKVTNADATISTYEYSWRASFTVTITENGGKALDITQLNLNVQMASGGIVIQPSGGETVYYKFTSSAGGNRINANDSATVGFTVWYDLPNDQKEALATVSLGFQDDDDNQYAKSIAVKVAP